MLNRLIIKYLPICVKSFIDNSLCEPNFPKWMSLSRKNYHFLHIFVYFNTFCEDYYTFLCYLGL